MSELARRLEALEKRLIPPPPPVEIRRDVEIRDADKILAIYRRLYVSGGRDLVESVFLSVQPDVPLLDELMRALEKSEIVEEAERVVRGTSGPAGSGDPTEPREDK